MSRNLHTVLGVDEAGYGPLLGPLVVGAAAFHVPSGAARELTEVLSCGLDGSGAIPVADSKRLYRSGAGLRLMESVVLAVGRLAKRSRLPDPSPSTRPWSLGSSPALPVFAEPAEVEARFQTIRAAFDRSGVQAMELSTRTVGVEEFNRGVRLHGSKARVLFDAAMDLIEPHLEGEGEVDVRVDRHGGRTHYASLLADRLSGRLPDVVSESSLMSSYIYRRREGDARVSFEVDGDGRRFSIALASMAAKYVRELHMRAFNAHFQGEDPSLRRTAGYYVDARRWLKESRALRRRMGVEDEALVRLK